MLLIFYYRPSCPAPSGRVVDDRLEQGDAGGQVAQPHGVGVVDAEVRDGPGVGGAGFSAVLRDGGRDRAVLAHDEPHLLPVGRRLELGADAFHRADVGTQRLQDREDVDASVRARQVDARQPQAHFGGQALALCLVE